jgi:hypothetical protein
LRSVLIPFPSLSEVQETTVYNRRANYRHRFSRRERIPVEVKLVGMPLPLVGETVDLSIGGIQVWFADQGLSLRVADPILVTPEVPGAGSVLTLHGEVVYCHSQRKGYCSGIQFLSSVDPAVQENREKLIWRFLLDEQRRARRD